LTQIRVVPAAQVAVRNRVFWKSLSLDHRWQAMEISRKSVASIVISGMLWFGILEVAACNFAWDVPKNHFDGVNEQGKLSYWLKIGEVDLVEGVKIPLIINFNSARESSSPYLGKGWMLFPLESNIVQTDETTFLMYQPQGLKNWFGRKAPTETTIKGASNWAGEIRSNAITVWTDCGWKLEYLNGKMAAMTGPKNEKIDFGYNNGKVSEMRYGGSSVLRVESDAVSGETKALVYGGKRIEIQWGDKPRVRVNNGGSAIAGEDRSLNKLTLADGATQDFIFGVKGLTQPTLKVTAKGKEDRVFAWEPKDRTILSDNDWRYSIKSGNPRDNAAIERKNSKGEIEFWFRDDPHGQEITQTTDGVRTVRSWFTRGILAGKVRRLEQTAGGKTIVTYQATYDVKGQLIREKDSTGITLFCYEHIPATTDIRITATISGKIAWTKIKDAQGRLLEDVSSNGNRYTYSYPAKNHRIVSHTTPSNKTTITYFSNNLITKRIWPDGRIEEYKYFPASSRLKMRKDSKNNQWEYRYVADTDRLSMIFFNGKVDTSYVFDKDNNRTLIFRHNPDGTAKVCHDKDTNRLVPLSSLDQQQLFASGKMK
jgi:YD repeat-containing protein